MALGLSIDPIEEQFDQWFVVRQAVHGAFAWLHRRACGRGSLPSTAALVGSAATAPEYARVDPLRDRQSTARPPRE
jgi:hypothetical protein